MDEVILNLAFNASKMEAALRAIEARPFTPDEIERAKAEIAAAIMAGFREGMQRA